MSPNRRSSAAAPSTFEAALADLQQVVAELETGGVDLERALALYQRGIELADACDRLIQAAELRVTRLAPESASPLAESNDEP